NLQGATETAGQIRQKSKAAEHSRTPKPRGVLLMPINPIGFGDDMSCWRASQKSATPTNIMTTSLNNSEVRAEQAASTKVQTLKLGLDIHADSIVVVRILEHSAPQPAQKF